MQHETPRSPAPVPVVALAFGALVFTALILRFDFLIDDAFISFRYAVHWAEGHGLRYNLDEAPVEGFSNFLWVVLLRAAAELGALPETASRVLSVAAALLQLLVFRRLLARTVSPAVGLLALILFATHPPAALWATGGLETAAFGLALLWTFELATRESMRPGALLVGSLCVATLRVDGFLWVLVLHALGALRMWSAPTSSADAADARTSGRARAWTLAAFALAYGLFLLWRWNTFGAWVSNTTLAKAGLSGATLTRGVRATASYGLVLVAPLVALIGAHLALAAGLARRTTHADSGTLAAAGALFLGALGFHVLVGGDWMPMFRFLAPFAPMFALCTALALEPLLERSRALGVGAAAALVLLQLGPAFDLHAAPRAVREWTYFRGFRRGYETELERWERAQENTQKAQSLGRALAQIGGPEDRLVTGAIGAIGYYSGIGILDRNGLVDPGVAAFPMRAEAGTAGHDRRAPRSAFLDRNPRWLRVALASGPRSETPERMPHWKQAFRQLGRYVTREDPLDDRLLEHCVGRVYALEPEEVLPLGLSLVALEYTPDVEAARAFWRDLGIPIPPPAPDARPPR